MSNPGFERYSAVAIVLHWLIALAILALIAIGFVMTRDGLPSAEKFALFQLHKSIGVTVLFLVVLRIGWRLMRRPPPLPRSMPPFERGAAHAGHGLLYLLMLGMPLSGWMLVSASTRHIPTVLYGLIAWPHLPVPAILGEGKAAEALMKSVHDRGAYALAALVTLHIAAALGHHFIRHDEILARMAPFLRRGAGTST